MMIEIEEKDWVKCDDFENFDLEVIAYPTGLTESGLEELIEEKFPRLTIDEKEELKNYGYLYGVGYVASEIIGVRKVAFRTKNSDIRKLIWNYTNKITKIIEHLQRTK